MSSDDRGFIWEASYNRISRRSLLKGAAAIGGVAALGPLAAACGGDDTSSSASPSAAAGTANKGGDLMVGIVGGSAKDTADPHKGSYEPDIAIQYIMYEGLTSWSFDMELENLLAESIEPNADDRQSRQNTGRSGPIISCSSPPAPSTCPSRLT